MLECTNLIHPFQNDPGVSQAGRVIDELLSDDIKIDGRTLADLLNYFSQLSSGINYYDKNLNVSDWQPFFKDSIPFVLAGIHKFDATVVEEKFRYYTSVFEKRPSHSGLQLNIYYFFYNTINKINQWQLKVKDTGLPITIVVADLITNKLRQPLKDFICLTNTAVKWYCVKRIDFSKFTDNEIWNLGMPDIYCIDESFRDGAIGKCNTMQLLQQRFTEIFSPFLEAIKILADVSEQNINESLLPLQEEFQKNHTPHLGLLFAFIKLFQKLQGELNKKTKDHLTFFYKDVLQLKLGEAKSDHANIVFELQNQLNKHLLSKGLKVKDGKDDKQQDILFSLDDEIVVNKAQVAEVRTLFLNNDEVYDKTFLEGVYIAPAADKADGVEKDFKDGDPANWYTLGNNYSKYTDPGKDLPKSYPNARLGFILASPVLLLNEGTRTVDIALACELNDSFCKDIADKCIPRPGIDCPEYPEFYSAKALYDEIQGLLEQTFYYISEDLIDEAVKNGLSTSLAQKIRENILEETKTNICGEDVPGKKNSALIQDADWVSASFTSPEITLLEIFFKPRRILKISFSGEDGWIEPSSIVSLTFDPLTLGTASATPVLFTLRISVQLEIDKGAVTFYNKEKLKEDFNTTQPVVKIELDDVIKLNHDLGKDKLQKDCCLERDVIKDHELFSFYHFFRNVIIHADSTTQPIPTIKVTVCGLKNFIVQNDENVLDVNNPVYPFGTRPDIIDFTVVNPSPTYIINVNFIATVVAKGISQETQTFLSNLPKPFKIGTTQDHLSTFLDENISENNISAGDKAMLLEVFSDILAANRNKQNLIGPNFYVGSKEVFCKKWDEVFINLNWQNKPSNFKDYYKGYFARVISDDPLTYDYGIDQAGFQINLSVLQNAIWKQELQHDALPTPFATFLNEITTYNNRLLFPEQNKPSFCLNQNPFAQTIYLKKEFFRDLIPEFKIDSKDFKKFDTTSKTGFLKINLQNQDFLHKDYAYVLARQMLAAGKLPREIVEDAVYYDSNGDPLVIDSDAILKAIETAIPLAAGINSDVNDVSSHMGNTGSISEADAHAIRDTLNTQSSQGDKSLKEGADSLQTTIGGIAASLESIKQFSAIIPNEPWTPVISNMLLDYTANAFLKDIDLIHLYPYEGTYKSEDIELEPSLLPVFCDEGTLFIGLKDLVPGSNLNILFQLAEATSDSESEIEELHWYYLENNVWKELRKGFEILLDADGSEATEGLTTSGIIKFAMPETMTKDNTILPKDLYWIKATVAKNSKCIAETIKIYTQAVSATFTNTEANDKLRLSQPLVANSLSKLEVADASIKTVLQPYDSFDGQVPEIEGHYYLRVSELLRHKGRAIQKWDYERIALEEFQQVFKAKCITHSFKTDAHKFFNDVPLAPGYVLLAVIPDLTKLKSGNSFEPKVPLSMLEKIQEYLQRRTSPFVRLWVENPRYEKVHFCLKIRLVRGKDEIYYKEKVKEDLSNFLAPWAVGEYYKLTFGQCVNRSDIIRFLETKDYVDFILEIRMQHENDTGIPEDIPGICPRTPRSILIAGDIDAEIDPEVCDEWCLKLEPDQVLKCTTEKIPIVKYC